MPLFLSLSLVSHCTTVQDEDSDADSEDEKIDEDEDDKDSLDGTIVSVEETLQDELIHFLGDDPNRPKMLVCSAYLDGKCTSSICPRAHPGIRDDAHIDTVRLPGRPRKTNYVICCPVYDGSVITGCKAAGQCKLYHVYIRPSECPPSANILHFFQYIYIYIHTYIHTHVCAYVCIQQLLQIATIIQFSY